MSPNPPLNASAKAHTHREIKAILGGLMTRLMLAVPSLKSVGESIG